MKFPTIHLNGTSKKALQDAIEEAARAITSARKALQETSPHARDYYPQGPDAFPKARDEYVARRVKLEEIYSELLAIWESMS